MDTLRYGNIFVNIKDYLSANLLSRFRAYDSQVFLDVYIFLGFPISGTYFNTQDKVLTQIL